LEIVSLEAKATENFKKSVENQLQLKRDELKAHEGIKPNKPEVGEEFTAWEGYISGKYLELEKGKRIVQEWINTDWPEGLPPSKFELTFKATKEGTEISMVQSNIPADQEKELLDGWTEFYWNPLKEYFSKKPKEKN
jgi:activator of HSP90 ATPase